LTAAEEGQAESVRALLALGAGVNCGDRNRETALYKAAKAGRAEAADVLIRVGKADVNKLSAFGSTPLHEAAVRGHTHIVELLLRHGASHSLKDHEGVTPLEVRWRGRQAGSMHAAFRLGFGFHILSRHAVANGVASAPLLASSPP
jgi:ankyrin repeat protein